MLKPHECIPGSIENAEPMTLVLPNTQYGERLLTFSAEGKKFALLLSGAADHIFRFVECNDSHAWRGLLVPNVAIELDADSLFNGDGYSPPLGSIVRRGASLSLQTVALVNRFHHFGGLFDLLDGLPEGHPSVTVCFTKWQIVLGEGQEKRVLHSVDVTPDS